MVDISTFNLYFEIIGVAIFAYGCFYLVRAALKVENKFKSAIYFLLVAFLFHIAGSLVTWRLVSIDLDFNSVLWLISPALNFIEAVFYVIGASKFYKALKE